MERRITDLEKDVQKRDEIITEQKGELERLGTERVALAQKRDSLQGQLTADEVEHAHAIFALNASIAIRDKQVGDFFTGRYIPPSR